MPPGVDQPIGARCISRHLTRNAVHSNKIQSGAKLWLGQPAGTRTSDDLPHVLPPRVAVKQDTACKNCSGRVLQRADAARRGPQAAHLFLRLDARTFQNVVSAPAWAPRPTAPALLKTRSPWPVSMLLNSVPYGAALRTVPDHDVDAVLDRADTCFVAVQGATPELQHWSLSRTPDVPRGCHLLQREMQVL